MIPFTDTFVDNRSRAEKEKKCSPPTSQRQPDRRAHGLRRFSTNSMNCSPSPPGRASGWCREGRFGIRLQCLEWWAFVSFSDLSILQGTVIFTLNTFNVCPINWKRFFDPSIHPSVFLYLVYVFMDCSSNSAASSVGGHRIG